jgi:hypothetical protein
MRSLFLLIVTGTLLTTSCKTEAPSPASVQSAAALTASAAAAPKLPTPKPLSVDNLERALKCRGADGPCQVLKQFKDCIAWNPAATSTDSRWLGRGHVVRKGSFTDEYTLLRSRRVPVSETGPGQMNAKFAISSIPELETAARRHADKALRAYKRRDVVKATNATVRYIKERSEWLEVSAMLAEKNQVYVASDGGAYLCALKDQRLLLVERSTNPEHPGDGTYVILWPVSW